MLNDWKKRVGWSTVVAGLIVLGLGGVIGWYGRIAYNNRQPSRLVELRLNSSQYHYINPLFLLESPRQAPEYNSLKKEMADYLAQAEGENKITTGSVYFRDLNKGKWTGVNEDQVYDPSSMLKVAVMVGYLNAADNDPAILYKSLSYTPHLDPGQNYKPSKILAPGSYSVKTLIEAMIVDSDNDALTALYNNNREVFVNVLKELDIPPPPNSQTLDFMSPKTYSKVFRTLYNSTYLSRDTSEQALKLLTSTTFNYGLVAGVPEGIEVAHKFGEHTDLVNSQLVSRQLHDCGIVYVKKNPYFLCIMTKGDDFKQMEKVISDLSAMVYRTMGEGEGQ